MKTLADDKAAGHDFTRMILYSIARSMLEKPLTFEVFLGLVPGRGKPVADRIQRESETDMYAPHVAWRRFASCVIVQARIQGNLMAPHSCLMAPEEIKHRWRKMFGNWRSATEEVIKAHLGEPEALRKYRGVFCVGCPKRGCKNHLIPEYRTLPSSEVPVAPERPNAPYKVPRPQQVQLLVLH